MCAASTGESSGVNAVSDALISFGLHAGALVSEYSGASGGAHPGAFPWIEPRKWRCDNFDVTDFEYCTSSAL